MKLLNQRDILEYLNNGATIRWDTLNAKVVLLSAENEVMGIMFFNTYTKLTLPGNAYEVQFIRSDFQYEFYGRPADKRNSQKPAQPKRACRKASPCPKPKPRGDRLFGYFDAMRTVAQTTLCETKDERRRMLCDIVDKWLPEYSYELVTDQDIENALAAMYKETGKGFPQHLNHHLILEDD